MGSFCTSKPQTTNTSQTQSYTANPVISGAGTQAIGMAESAASQPFQTPAAPVAPFNPFQQQSFSQIQGLQGGTDPFFQNASANMTTAQQPVTQQDIAGFENPYGDQALAAMKKYVFDPQRTQGIGSATQAAGGVGADRLALTSQNLDKTQADAVGQAQAGFYGQALSAAQQSKQQALQSAQGWANLGLGQQGAKLQATGALAGAGNQQQAQSQAELMSPYEQTLAQIAYPYQQAQFLAGITGGLSGAFGGTTTGQGTQTVQQAQPSWFNQIAGLGIAGLGAYGSAGGFGAPSGAGASSGNPFSSYNVNNGYVPSINGGGTLPGYADGGEVNEDMGVIPHMDLPNTSGQGQAHNNLNLTPTKTDSGGGSSGGLGDVMKMAAQVAPMFLNRGGPINPWDSAKRYAQFRKIYKAGGGEVEEVSPEDFNSIDAAAPPESFNSRYGDRVEAAGPAMPTLRQLPASPPTQSTWDATPVAWPSKSGSSGLPPIPRQPTERIAGYGPSPAINTDMKIGDFEMPKASQPYPDALDRDFGQTAARSPWMALVHAGAKMAQSTKSGAAGLAEGVEAGATHLDTQRKELRTEQQINQKAEELYRHARSELNKYTRKTPHELATEQESTRYHNIVGSLGQSKIENQMATGNLVYAGPVKDEPGMGYFYDKKRLGPDGQPSVFKAPFDPGEKPGTAARPSGRVAAHELYKKLYPDDARGAQDILLGHKTLTRDDVRKRIEATVTNAMKAQPIQPGTTEWLEEHKRRSDEMMAKVTQEYGL